MEKKNRKGYCIKSDSDYLCNPFWKEHEWEFSSAGSEHLPYKQRVGGSNPSTPTISLEFFGAFFFLRVWGSPVILRDQLPQHLSNFRGFIYAFCPKERYWHGQ